MKQFILTLCLFLASTNSNAHGYLDNPNVFKMYTEGNFYPFNYVDEKGQLKGIGFDITQKIFSNARFQYSTISTLPWARAYETVLHHRNTGVFSIFRIKLREELFEWVGPITSSKIVLLKKRDKELEPNYTITTIRNSAADQTLLDKGFSPRRILAVNNSKNSFDIIMKDRADVWAVNLANAQEYMRKNNLDFNDFQILEVLYEQKLYIALNKQSDPKIIEFFNEEMKKLQKSGFIDEVLKKYNYNPNVVPN